MSTAFKNDHASCLFTFHPFIVVLCRCHRMLFSFTHTHNMISFTKSLAYKNVYFAAEMLKWERSAVEHGAGPAASELELKGLAKELSGLDCKHAVCPIHISHISKL